jgi:hypothetical protein
MPTAQPVTLAGHALHFDPDGRLEPWGSWQDILTREMNFYQECPTDNGYRRFIHATFLDAEWNPLIDRTDNIPATQNGMGIISYLKFFEFGNRRDLRYLNTARRMGDYLVQEALTPDIGRYPRFTRSTGQREQFPLQADAGSQGDRPYEIQPDKGGIAGHALMELFAATEDPRYFAQALHNARVLAANQGVGDSNHSPWPFRADYRTGDMREAPSAETWPMSCGFTMRCWNVAIRNLQSHDRRYGAGSKGFRSPAPPPTALCLRNFSRIMRRQPIVRHGHRSIWRGTCSRADQTYMAIGARSHTT